MSYVSYMGYVSYRSYVSHISTVWMAWNHLKLLEITWVALNIIFRFLKNWNFFWLIYKDGNWNCKDKNIAKKY